MNQARWQAIPHSKKIIIVTLRRSRYGVCRLFLLAVKRSPVSKRYEAWNEFDFARPLPGQTSQGFEAGVVNKSVGRGKGLPGFHSALI